MDELKVALAEKDKERIGEILDKIPNMQHTVQFLSTDGICLLAELCKLGFTDLMAFVISHGVDIKDANKQENLISIACVHKQRASLEYLLKNYPDIPMLPDGVEPWHDKSPFYITSKRGQGDLLLKLYSHSPGLIKQDDVRASLLYTACLGGSIDCFKLWISPGININSSISLTQFEKDFGNFDKHTPLYAVCSGGHTELLSYMMNNFPSLELNQTTINEYPDLIGKFVKSFFKPLKASTKRTDRQDDEVEDEVFQMCVGNLEEENLHAVHASWLLPYTVTLQELDLHGNKLTELPTCLPWKFQNLKKLDVSGNNLKSLTGPKDAMGYQQLCPSLIEINMSNNKLENVCVEIFCIPTLTKLNLSGNKLSFLVKSIHQDAELQRDRTAGMNRNLMSFSKVLWNCTSLRILDVSNNALQMIPSDISQCQSLCDLKANQNHLTAFPQPWECPLKHLDLSNNQLERFPVDTEKYWCSSLKKLNLSNNRLDEINEGIVKLNILTDLDASSNRIERLPAPDIWECGHLDQLNLKNNRLGSSTYNWPSKIKGFSLRSVQAKSRSEDGSQVNFPTLLATCLTQLDLANNNLDCVPPSVCNLKLLENLDLSNNKLIRTLPIEMGKLKNCQSLKLEGLTVDNIKDIPTEGKLQTVTRRILNQFMEKLRDCREYNKLKTIVLGKKDKGKSTLVGLLANKKGNSIQENVSIRRGEVISKRKASFSLMAGEKKEVKLNVWDIAGDEPYTLIHHSMFTKHTLYLLVWDFWSIESELDQIGKLLYNIQATTKYYSVILIGTFLDKTTIKEEELEKKERDISTKLRKFKLGRPIPVCAISCINNKGIEKLKEVINCTAQSMKLPGMQVPKSYLDLEKAVMDKTAELVQNKKPPVLTQAEFTELVESVKDEELLTSEVIHNVTRFLVDTGSLLHFCDQLGALNTLYFLDPAWFCDVLVHILINPDGKRKLKEGKGKISRVEVEKIYKNDERFPNEYIDQYIEMLERFEIALTVDNAQKLFFPCQLPENPPLCDPYDKRGDYKKICRLYRMAHCPTGFWTHLLTRMMARVEHFSTSGWYYQPLLKQSVRKMPRKIPRMKDPKNINTYYGLQLKNTTKTFCREWIFVQHDGGSFCVEPVIGRGDESFSEIGDDDELQKGILITEIDTTGKFGMIGVIVDEIEDIIHDFYPCLLDPGENMQLQIMRFALCSSCYAKNPTVHHIDHFTMEHCARKLVEGDFIVCPEGHVHKLETLVPDLLMKELPDRFILDNDQLNVVEKDCIGEGAAGSVFKGTYGTTQIAVKIYRSDIRNEYTVPMTSGSYNRHSSDSGTATISTLGSTGIPYIEDDEVIYANPTEVLPQKDLDEAESIKALNALKEMRQEVALTSRLQHPCIISLVGILFRPKLMMALELAPLGSLRDILYKQQENRPVFRKYLDRDKEFPPIFDKELTFKFVYQIALGLKYLHSCGIIYKDLKSDNILAMSLDVEATVNLKLSDYGISKYSWGGRSVGLVGTPGYQAPEILDELPYDEKVDIFSLSMVIYEILTGNRPYMEYDNVWQISKAIKIDEKRPSIKEFCVRTHFPYLESLMVSCWQRLASERPDAAAIVKKTCMRNAQFIVQRSATTFDDVKSHTFAKGAVIGATVDDGPSTLWIWEGDDIDRCVTLIDVEKSSFRFKKYPFEGPQVVCMGIVDKQVWIGTTNKTIEVCGAGSGKLQKVNTITLASLPLYILPYKEKTFNKKLVTVYVAENDGHLLKYQSETIKRDSPRRPTMKRIDGYSEPKSCTLRSTSIHCMTLTNRSRDMWISHTLYIDVVSCADFKVISDRRINMEVLNSICKIPKNLEVCEMVSNDTQVFCLLKMSPIVLEFDSCGNCLCVIQMTERLVLETNVCTRLALSDFDHEGYHGSIPKSNRNSSNSASSNDSDDKETIEEASKGFMGTWQKRSTHDISPPPVPPRGKNINNRTEGVLHNNSKLDVSPPVPPRLFTCSSGELNTSINDNVVPPRNPDITNVAPRSPKPFPRSNNVNIRTADEPALPPRSAQGCVRPMPLYTGEKEKVPIKGKASMFYPNIYQRSPSIYDFCITSIQIVDDSLWVGRSYGDVCVVDINSDINCTSHGQVVASMKDLGDKHRDTFNKKPKLAKVGDYMATAYNKDTDDIEECFEIASWDCHGADYFRKVDKYWTDLLAAEKGLSNQGAGQNNDTLQICSLSYNA